MANSAIFSGYFFSQMECFEIFHENLFSQIVIFKIFLEHLFSQMVPYKLFACTYFREKGQNSQNSRKLIHLR